MAAHICNMACLMCSRDQSPNLQTWYEHHQITGIVFWSTTQAYPWFSGGRAGFLRFPQHYLMGLINPEVQEMVRKSENQAQMIVELVVHSCCTYSPCATQSGHLCTGQGSCGTHEGLSTSPCRYINGLFPAAQSPVLGNCPPLGLLRITGNQGERVGAL